MGFALAGWFPRGMPGEVMGRKAHQSFPAAAEFSASNRVNPTTTATTIHTR